MRDIYNTPNLGALHLTDEATDRAGNNIALSVISWGMSLPDRFFYHKLTTNFLARFKAPIRQSEPSETVSNHL